MTRRTDVPARFSFHGLLPTLALVAAVAPSRAQVPALVPSASHGFGLSVGSPPVLENGTGLYASVRIEELSGESPTEVRRHVDGWFDPSMLSPQAGLFAGFMNSTLPLDELRGVNARITILTPGCGPDQPFESDEIQVQDWLMARTCSDQIIMPIVSVLGGGRWDDWKRLEKSTKRKAIDALISALLNQNYNLLNDIRVLAARGDGAAVANLVLNTILREVGSGGPILTALGPEIGERIASNLAKSAMKKLVPGVNIVSAAIQFADISAALAVIANTVRDLKATPGSLPFHVYYHPGLGRVTPTLFRPRPAESQEFLLDGFGFELARRRGARATLLGPGDVVLSTVPIAGDKIRSERMFAAFPAEDLREFEGLAMLRLEIGDESFVGPDVIRVIGRIGSESVDPPRGRVGAVVRIAGEGLDQYFANVFFGEYPTRIRRARVLLARADSYLVEVPAMAAGPCEIWIEEDARGAERRSDGLHFEVLEGDGRARLEEIAEERMPEGSETVEGLLAANEDHWTHEFRVPGGMQVTARLKSLEAREPGASRADIRRFALELLPTAGDTEFRTVDSGADAGTGVRAYALRSHTSDGSQPVRTYRVAVESGAGPATRLEVELAWNRVDDLGRGIDAHGGVSQLPWIERYRTTRTGHLFGGRRVFAEDLRDAYRIEAVDAGRTLTVTVESIEGVVPWAEPAGLARVRLYEAIPGTGAGESRFVSVAQEFDLEAGRAPSPLAHAVDRKAEFLLVFDHGRGNIRYRFRVDVDDSQLSGTPVVSDFDGRTEEGWTLAEEDGASAGAPELRPSEGGVGLNSWLHADRRTSLGTIDLELVLAVDTTRSMQPHIESVRRAADSIVSRLSDRCQNLRVGLVSYRDQQADAQPFRRVGLNDRPRATIEMLGAWGLGSGGRDVPEDVLQGLRHALEVDWSPVGSSSVLRAVILLGDAPAKLDGETDFAGNSIASIIAMARERRVTILPITIGDSSELSTQARQLARGTGGTHMPLQDAEALPDRIIDLSAQAIEQQRIRYWNAPRKFLGARGAAFGQTLAFRLGSRGGVPLDAPDVILDAGSVQLGWRGYLRPMPRASIDEPGTVVRIALDPSAGWYDMASGNPVEARRMRWLLNSLVGLRIRADHVVGGEGWLDDVSLGSSDKPTHFAPDADVRGYLERLEQSMRAKLAIVELAGDLRRLAAFAGASLGDTMPEPMRTNHATASGARVLDGLSSIASPFVRQRIETRFRDRVASWTDSDRPDRQRILADLRAADGEMSLARDLLQAIKELCRLQASAWVLHERAEAASGDANRRDHERSRLALLEAYGDKLAATLERSQALR